MSWFLLALLIPLIIHLFYFRQINQVIFTGVSLLQEIVQEKKNNHSLKHLILLILRTLFFACLIYSFVDYGKNEAGQKRNTLFLVDNSISTSLQGQNQNSVLNSLLRFVELSVSQNSDYNSQQIASFGQSSVSKINSFNKNEVLSSLRGSRDVKNYGEILERYADGDWNEVFILSDFQGKNVISQFEEIETESRLKLVHGRVRDRSNVYVDSVYLQNLFLSPNAENELVIELSIANYAELNEITLRLLNGDYLLSTYTVEINNSKQIVMVPLDASSLKDRNITIEIIDSEVEYDNQYFLSLPYYQKVKITHVYEDFSSPYIESVYSNTELFEYHSFSVNNPSYEFLENADLVILDQLNSIPDFIAMGGLNTIVVVPNGITADLSSYSRYLGVSLRKFSNDLATNVDPISLSQDIFAGTFENVDESTRLPNVRCLYALDEGNTGEKILVDRFQRSLLAEIEGIDMERFKSLYFFSFPFELQYTDLMTHSIFVPMMYGLAFKSIQLQPIYSYRLDSRFISIPLVYSERQPTVTIEKDSISFVANCIRGGEGMQLEIPPDLHTPGFYQIRSGKDTLISFALNYPISESLMDFATEEELRDLASRFSGIEYMTAVTSEIISEAGGTPMSSMLWFYGLILASFFFISELLVARFL